MNLTILCAAAALLVGAAVQPATADDVGVCKQAIGDDAIAACTPGLAKAKKSQLGAIERASRIGGSSMSPPWQ
jgi:hypothetical protein